MKATITLAMLLVIQAIGFCQFKKEKLKFTSIEQVGFTTAKASGNWELQTINGVRYKSWSAGIGIGTDWHKIRSGPLFLDVRKHFGNRKNNWFVYADAGENVGWKKNGNIYYNEVSSHYSNTFFAESGIGYSISLKNKHALLLSVGYGNKKIENNYSYWIYTDIVPGTSFLVTGIDRSNIDRFILKAAIQF